MGREPLETSEERHAEQSSYLPSHLIPMGHESWALWRLLAVRGTGFPIAELLKLSTPACALAADRLIAEEIPGNGDQHNVSAALHNFRRTFDQALLQTSRVVYETAQMLPFREAVIWQNRQAFHNMIERLTPPPMDAVDLRYRNSQQRRREEMVALYLQRYCAKNETIGFFGPGGWGTFTPQGAPITVLPAPHLLAKRQVYFEEWGIGILARKLSQARALRPWIAPQRHPFVYAGATDVCLPGIGTVTFSWDEAAILALCDGRRLAREIAAELRGRMDDNMVYDTLERLGANGLVSWFLRIPIQTNPEEVLYSALDRVGDEGIRAAALAELTELEQARVAVARAAGDPEKLDHALADLENTFLRLTGEEATRLQGQMFVGRSLLYEDCVRDVAVEVGPEIRAALAEPLALLFTSARWFSWKLAEHYTSLFQEVYQRAVKETGERLIPVTAIWDQLGPRLFSPGQAEVQALGRDLQQRWATMLGLPSSQHQLAYTAAELRSRVLAAFAAPRPGWKRARYASADILVDATGLDAIQRGEYLLVVGDFHLSNPLAQSFHLHQHPVPEEVTRDFVADLPGGLFTPVFPTGGSITPRISYGIRHADDVWLQMSPDASVNPHTQVLSLGELLLDAPAGEVVLRTRDGRLTTTPLTIFEFALFLQMLQHYSLFGNDAHIPRITVDRVVIHRESWSFAASTISFASETDEAARFLAVRRWAHQHEIPRFLFAKLPHEAKPFYVDLESPVFVNILAKGIRNAQRSGGADAQITVMEMLPTPEGVWLPDAEGRRYTSELRLVALDLLGTDFDHLTQGNERSED